MVLISFAVNMLITWIIFLLSQKIAGFMGQGGLTAVSRVFSLLLAAIAVSMVIGGLNRSASSALPVNVIRKSRSYIR